MRGGYIQCDDFSGDDKSGFAMSGVLEELPPAASKRLIHVVESLFKEYRQRFGDAGVWNAIELDNDSGLDPIEAKGGKGSGWRYYCLTDLPVALQRSIDSDADVCVSFD